MNSSKKIGNQIRERRKLLSLELDDIKDYSGVATSTISLIENAKGNPTLKTLEKILVPLGMELSIKIKQK